MTLREQFRQLGYVAVGPVLSQRELKALRTACDRTLAREDLPTRYHFLSGKDQADVVVQVLDVYRLERAFRRLLSKKKLLDLAAAFIGCARVCLYTDQVLDKPARHGGLMDWHRDNEYWQLDPATAVSCWIALDDATPENGCLWMIPGSHRGGETEDPLVDESLAVPVPLPAGSAVFHHCRTLHRSRPNRSPHGRRVYAIHYLAPDTRQRDIPLGGHLLLR